MTRAILGCGPRHMRRLATLGERRRKGGLSDEEDLLIARIWLAQGENYDVEIMPFVRGSEGPGVVGG